MESAGWTLERQQALDLALDQGKEGISADTLELLAYNFMTAPDELNYDQNIVRELWEMRDWVIGITVKDWNRVRMQTEMNGYTLYDIVERMKLADRRLQTTQEYFASSFEEMEAQIYVDYWTPVSLKEFANRWLLDRTHSDRLDNDMQMDTLLSEFSRLPSDFATDMTADCILSRLELLRQEKTAQGVMSGYEGILAGLNAHLSTCWTTVLMAVVTDVANFIRPVDNTLLQR